MQAGATLHARCCLHPDTRNPVTITFHAMILARVCGSSHGLSKENKLSISRGRTRRPRLVRTLSSTALELAKRHLLPVGAPISGACFYSIQQYYSYSSRTAVSRQVPGSTQQAVQKQKRPHASPYSSDDPDRTRGKLTQLTPTTKHHSVGKVRPSKATSHNAPLSQSFLIVSCYGALPRENALLKTSTWSFRYTIAPPCEALSLIHI